MGDDQYQYPLGKHATARTDRGYSVGEGMVISYSASPMVCIRREDGSRFWWRAALCEFEDVEEELLADQPGSEQG